MPVGRVGEDAVSVDMRLRRFGRRAGRPIREPRALEFPLNDSNRVKSALIQEILALWWSAIARKWPAHNQ